MLISTATVSHVATPAGPKLTSDETVRFASEMARIVGYFDRLAAVDTGSVDVSDEGAVRRTFLREDVVQSSLPVKEAPANAPESDGRFFLVPKVIMTWLV